MLIRINRKDDIVNGLYEFQFVTEEDLYFDEIITFDEIILHALEHEFSGNSTEMLFFYLFTKLGMSIRKSKYVQ